MYLLSTMGDEASTHTVVGICVNESTCQKPRVSTHTRLRFIGELRMPPILVFIVWCWWWSRIQCRQHLFSESDLKRKSYFSHQIYIVVRGSCVWELGSSMCVLQYTQYIAVFLTQQESISKASHSCRGSYVKTKCARFMLVRSGTGDPKHITIRLDNNERLVLPNNPSSTIHY